MYFVSNDLVLNKIGKIAFLCIIHLVTNDRLVHVLQAQSKTGGSLYTYTNQCGHHRPGNKISNSEIEFVKSSFPNYQSHCSQSNNAHRCYQCPDISNHPDVCDLFAESRHVEHYT